MDLTTVARVKNLLEISSAQHDTLLLALVKSVSQEVELFLNREIEEKARTEQYDVEINQRLWLLRAYPVKNGEVFEITENLDRDFSGDPIDPTNFYINERRGALKVERTFFIPRGPGVLEIVYTGGMADNTANFIVKFPAIAQATDHQVAFLFKRKDTLGISSFSSEGGSISMEIPVELIPMVKSVLNRFRRVGSSSP